MCMCVCMCVQVHVDVKEQLIGLVLSFNVMGSGDSYWGLTATSNGETNLGEG